MQCLRISLQREILQTSPPIKAYIVKKIDYELFSNFHIMFVFVHHKLVKSNHVV